MVISNFRVIKACNYSTFSRKGHSDTISLQLSLPDSDYFELGKGHIAAGPSHARFYSETRDKDKEYVQIFVKIVNIDVVEEGPYKMSIRQSEEFIGVVKFFEGQQGDFDYSSPSLYFVIGFSGREYKTLSDQLIQGNVPAKVNIEFDGFEFGWEPDGRSKHWDVDLPKNERPEANIREITFTHEYMECTELELQLADIAKEDKQEKQREMFKPNNTMADPRKKSIKRAWKITLATWVLFIILVIFADAIFNK